MRCSYSITANIDITEIYNRAKARSLRLYPTLIWWVANAVNHFEFLRFSHDESGNVGRYSTVHPSFTCMPPQSDRFHVLWTKYDPDSGNSIPIAYRPWTTAIQAGCSRWLTCPGTAWTCHPSRGSNSRHSISTHFLPIPISSHIHHRQTDQGKPAGQAAVLPADPPFCM